MLVVLVLWWLLYMARQGERLRRGLVHKHTAVVGTSLTEEAGSELLVPPVCCFQQRGEEQSVNSFPFLVS
uniref:Secreted protein n=1 Tax=Peronospora matthiolae TaxID=2874970 RepID=A0AAV1VBG0_9STRA